MNTPTLETDGEEFEVEEDFTCGICVTSASFDYSTSVTTGTIKADGSQKEDAP